MKKNRKKLIAVIFSSLSEFLGVCEDSYSGNKRHLMFPVTSPWSGGVRDAPGATRCRGLEVPQAAWGHVASGRVLRKDVGGLGHMLRPGAAVPCPPVSFPAGLGGQVMGDVFS